MIRSMTGFGRGECSNEHYKICVEIKSVNHRYLDLNVKMPKKCNPYEAKIRSILKEKIFRGKVDVYISCENLSVDVHDIRYNAPVAKVYYQYIKQISEEFDLPMNLSASRLSMFSDVITQEETKENEEALTDALFDALRLAIDQFVEARTVEGSALKDDLIGKLTDMEGYVDTIEKKYPAIIEAYRRRIEDKVKELLENTSVDENRIASEVVIYADKICVDEETVRLRTHIRSMKDVLTKGGAIGRKLDFIAQEMNRESNTILSKSTNAEIADVGILLKTDVEKVREQIQNIE